MADGLKLNLKEAIVLKNAEGTWWEIKGKDSSGASFSWVAPIAFVVDVSISQTVSFNIPLDDGIIDWGDGNTTAVTGSALYSHTYSASTGTYKVVVYGDVYYDWYLYQTTATNNVVSFISYGNVGDRISYFDSDNLTSCPSELPPRLTALNRAFRRCSSFNSPNVTTWDTSKITGMTSVFDDATAFNQDISGWDTQNVFSFIATFEGATSFNQDLSGWDVSGAVYMEGMFDGSSSFNQDLGSWDISNVGYMSYMFDSSGMSTENYSRTLIGWANSHFEGNAQDNVVLGAYGVTYNNTAYTTGNQFNDGASARAYLVGTAGWTITDGGQV